MDVLLRTVLANRSPEGSLLRCTGDLPGVRHPRSRLALP